MSRLLAGAGLLAAWLLAQPVHASPFTDVPTDHWAYESIDMLQQEGLVEGYPDGMFKGNRSFTRYEMAMVIARLYMKDAWAQDGPEPVGAEEFAEYQDLIDALMNEFRAEIDDIQAGLDAANGRIDGLEERVSTLEALKDSVTWSGIYRARVEDIITGQNSGFNLSSFNPSLIPAPTLGQGPGVGAEFEHEILIAWAAQPSDYLSVYADLYQISSDLDTPAGDVGAIASPPNQSLTVDAAYAKADIDMLLGYDEGLTPWLQRVDITVGRQYALFGAYGLTFDDGNTALPAVMVDAGDPRWQAQLFLGRDVNRAIGGQDGIGVARLAYGFGDSNQDAERGYFTRFGLNYLITGIGEEEGFAMDLDTELAGGPWLGHLKAEWYHAMEDQFSRDIADTFGQDLETSLILGLDLYDDGNTLVNARAATIGLPPGWSSVDNNPFEEYDLLTNGIGTPGAANINLGYETGLNYFPANFEGFGVTVQHTWFEKFFTDLTVFDGQVKSNEADLPVVMRLKGRYALSEASDLALEYIQAGIDAQDPIGKLRGEFLVRF